MSENLLRFGFRNGTELLLMAVTQVVRELQPGQNQDNLIQVEFKAMIYIMGQSNRACLWKAVEEGLAPKVITMIPEFSDVVKFRKRSQTHPHVIVWKGNQFNNRFMFMNPSNALRVHDDEADPAQQPEGKWVPRSALRRGLEPGFRPLADWLEGLKPGSKVILMGTPPPKSEALIRMALHNSDAGKKILSSFDEVRGKLRMEIEDLSALPIAPEALRLALWRLMQSEIARRAHQFDLQFLPIPARVCDERGLLLPEYSGEDLTHANARYGAVMIEEIQKMTGEAA